MSPLKHYTELLTLPVNVRRPQLVDMAEHPEGFAIESEQALLVVCSTQVPASQAGFLTSCDE